MQSEKYVNLFNTSINDIERYYSDRFAKKLKNDSNMHIRKNNAKVKIKSCKNIFDPMGIEPGM